MRVNVMIHIFLVETGSGFCGDKNQLASVLPKKHTNRISYRQYPNQTADDGFKPSQDLPLPSLQSSLHQNNCGPSALQCSVLQETRKARLELMKLNGSIGVIFANFLTLWRREKLAAITQRRRKERGDLR